MDYDILKLCIFNRSKTGQGYLKSDNTVKRKNYAHGSCFAVFSWPFLIVNDAFPCANDATLTDMCK